MAGAKQKDSVVTIDGHSLKLTNQDKVLYPSTGTTKAHVQEYLRAIAPVVLPYAAWRPATRKRWPDGVGTTDDPQTPFFRKDLEDSAPDWVPRFDQQHEDHTNTYPLANTEAVLAWFGQVAALEIHVPQWRFSPDGEQQNPDRLVFDLDPGEGAGLPECAEVALLCRTVLHGYDLEAFPLTSGSKGIHVYARLDGTRTSDDAVELAHEIAQTLEADHPNLAVSNIRKAERTGKVLVDWSQNHASRTTICPYSLRGRTRPTVAAPRTWDEVNDPGLRQLQFREVLERVAEFGDLLSGRTSE